MTIKTINNGIDYIARAASNYYALKYGQQASLKVIGQYLSRLIPQLAAAYTPLIGVCVINGLSDLVEKKICQYPKICGYKVGFKFDLCVQIIVRVTIGAGVFAAGTFFTGGTLFAPAMITGAKFGAFLGVADRLARIAIDFLRGLGFSVLRLVSNVSWCLSVIVGSDSLTTDIFHHIFLNQDLKDCRKDPKCCQRKYLLG